MIRRIRALVPPARCRDLALISLALLSLAAMAGAESILDTGEFWIDGPVGVQPGVDRGNAAVGFDRNGHAVVAWGAFGTDRYDIWLRRFDLEDQPLGDPVVANVLVADDQRFARLAVRPDGSLLVIWQSEEPDTSQTGDPIRFWIRGRLFNADLTPAAGELLISSISTDLNIDVSADVAALANGAFAVVWESNQSVGNDNQGTSIQGRIVSSAGQLSGGQFQVNDLINGGQRDSAVAALQSSGFVALWAGQSSGGDTGTSIQGRIFNNAGAPAGNDFQVNTTTPNTQDDPDIASDGSGGMLAVWESPTTASSRSQIFARLLSGAGAPLGNDFQIHATDTSSHQLEPRVGAAEPGRYLVTWYSDATAGNDPDRSVQGRFIRGEDDYIGDHFQVNVGRSGDQKIPDVAGAGSRFLVVFKDDQNPFAVNDDGLVGSGFDLCLFCDGFESGGTLAWSGATD